MITTSHSVLKLTKFSKRRNAESNYSHCLGCDAVQFGRNALSKCTIIRCPRTTRCHSYDSRNVLIETYHDRKRRTRKNTAECLSPQSIRRSVRQPGLNTRCFTVTYISPNAWQFIFPWNQVLICVYTGDDKMERGCSTPKKTISFKVASYKCGVRDVESGILGEKLRKPPCLEEHGVATGTICKQGVQKNVCCRNTSLLQLL
jgi:hypothetical protein